MREGHIKSFVSNAVVAVFLTSSTIASAALEMSPTATHYISGLAGPIEQVKFNDINGDGTIEALVSDGAKVALYSLYDETIVFQSTIDAGAFSYCILFDDVNRDHMPDILIGTYFENGCFQRDTVCRVEVYDGASGYTGADTLYFEAEIDFENGLQSPSSFVYLESFDISGDGYNELFLSFDKCRLYSLPPLGCIQSTMGQISLYAELPGEPAWTRPVLLRGISELETPNIGQLYVASRYEHFAFIPGDRRTVAWTEIISAGGDSLAAIGEKLEPFCTGDSSSVLSNVEYMCAGNIRAEADATDILIRYHLEQICYDADAVVSNESHTSLRLYRFGGPDDMELLWSDVSPAVTGNFHYAPDFPGYFFAASGGVIHQLSGLNGEVVESSDAIDADTIIWCPHPERSGGDFVAVKNQTLRIYQLDSQTDIIAGSEADAQPERFELSDPYPNPFNSSCTIEYSLAYPGHATITVHNILGQKVATIVDETRPAGVHTTRWNGTDLSGKPVASGVYLCRVTAGGFTDVKKVLLLK